MLGSRRIASLMARARPRAPRASRSAPPMVSRRIAHSCRLRHAEDDLDMARRTDWHSGLSQRCPSSGTLLQSVDAVREREREPVRDHDDVATGDPGPARTGRVLGLRPRPTTTPGTRSRHVHRVGTEAGDGGLVSHRRPQQVPRGLSQSGVRHPPPGRCRAAGRCACPAPGRSSASPSPQRSTAGVVLPAASACRPPP